MTTTFSQGMTGFAVGDVTVGNGTAGNFVAVSGAVYTIDVTPAAQGAVTVNVAGDMATLKSCVQCRYVHYCGKACQKKAWRIHKHECSGLRQLVNSTEEIMEAILTAQGELQAMD